jgi:hypothetical protein
LAKHFEGLQRFLFIYLLEREAGVCEHIVSRFDGRRAFDADAAADPAEANVGLEKAVTSFDGEDFAGDG